MVALDTVDHGKLAGLSSMPDGHFVYTEYLYEGVHYSVQTSRDPEVV